MSNSNLLQYVQFGVWLSLVEHYVRDVGVGGSNPLTPTICVLKADDFTFLVN
jgi:hypothetical protein